MRLLASILLAAMLFTPSLPAADPIEQSASDLQKEVQRLRKENDALKAENATLRKLLSERAPGAVAAPPAGATPATRITPTPAAKQEHWITNSSGKRHNRTCRYFMNSQGRPCGPNDGVACKICGG